MLGKFSGSHDDAKNYIESTFVHVQTYYCHSTWQAKIKLERIGEIIHIDDSWDGADLSSAKVLGITKQHIGSADLMIYINGIATNLLGKAGCLSCVCDKEIGSAESSRSWSVYKKAYWARHNVNVYQSTTVALAGVSKEIPNSEFYVHSTYNQNIS